jgi:hypothetical protein
VVLQCQLPHLSRSLYCVLAGLLILCIIETCVEEVPC